jgi:hypothetical protein
LRHEVRAGESVGVSNEDVAEMGDKSGEVLVCKLGGGGCAKGTGELRSSARRSCSMCWSQLYKPIFVCSKKMSRVHLIHCVRAGLLPAVADSSDIFSMICAEEINWAENIFIPFGGSRGATSAIGLHRDLVFFGALRKGSNGLLPGYFGGVRLGGPY